jgi:hypothetical protein
VEARAEEGVTTAAFALLLALCLVGLLVIGLMVMLEELME